MSRIPGLLARYAVGFVVGFSLAAFTLAFLGRLPPPGDLSLPDMQDRQRAEWIIPVVGAIAGLLAMFWGRLHLSRYWMWFVIAFGTICLIPFWPSKSGTLLPLGTPYVNGSYCTDDVILLVIHTTLAAILAGIAHWGARRLRPRWTYKRDWMREPHRPRRLDEISNR